MTDLSLLFYTSNRIGQRFAAGVMQELIIATADICPLIVISQNGDDYRRQRQRDILRVAHVIAVAAEPSVWQVYQNILIGAKAAETDFVACCEDDTLYTPDHFTFRPPADTFFYNLNRWWIEEKQGAHTYRWRKRTSMCGCIAPRGLLIETLEEKFSKYPVAVSHEEAKRRGWGEPGRYEGNLGLTLRKREFFESKEPIVTFNHRPSLMGKRAAQEADKVTTNLPPWGDATDLWNRIHG